MTHRQGIRGAIVDKENFPAAHADLSPPHGARRRRVIRKLLAQLRSRSELGGLDGSLVCLGVDHDLGAVPDAVDG